MELKWHTLKEWNLAKWENDFFKQLVFRYAEKLKLAYRRGRLTATPSSDSSFNVVIMS